MKKELRPIRKTCGHPVQVFESERDFSGINKKTKKRVKFHPSTLKTFSDLTLAAAKANSEMPSELRPKEFKDLSEPITTNCNDGDRLGYIKSCTQSLKASHVQRVVLLKRLKDADYPPSLQEIEYLRELYEEDVKLQQQLSDALEVGRLNMQRRRELELQRLEDYYYERYGFVFIEPETLEASSLLPPPQGILDLNRNGRTWEDAFANHDHEEMEKELQRLKIRLDNLGKSPKIGNKEKRQKSKKSSKSEQRCSIV